MIPKVLSDIATRSLKERVQQKQINTESTIFEIISDFYYRENFHSQILRWLLEIESFYKSFIETLELNEIDYKDFTLNTVDIKITTELMKIDILIANEKCKKAIIVENKINNAADTEKQLLNYKNKLESRDYTVSKIVYISQNGLKTPDTTDWTHNEIEQIETKLKLVSACRSSNTISLEQVIEECLPRINNIDQISILQQYNRLLKKSYLTRMNFDFMQELYKTIKTEADFEKLLELKNMIADLPKFRALRIMEILVKDPKPFKIVKSNGEIIVFLNNYQIADLDIAIDIKCLETTYEVSIFDRRNTENCSSIDAIVKKLEIPITEHRENSNRLFRTLKFPEQEQYLIELLREVKGKLSAL